MVIAQRHPGIHHKIIDKLSMGAARGSKTYMQSYQKALSDVISTLTKADIDDAKETARRWNNLGPPHDIQCQCVNHY